MRAYVTTEDMKFVIMRDLALGGDHAVVAARFDGDWIILDNRWLTPGKDSEMRRMVPLLVPDAGLIEQS